MPPKATKPPESVGVISVNEAYTLDQVKSRLGIGTSALRTARHKGLQVRRIGRKSFVMGRDILAYLDEHAVVVP